MYTCTLRRRHGTMEMILLRQNDDEIPRNESNRYRTTHLFPSRREFCPMRLDYFTLDESLGDARTGDGLGALRDGVLGKLSRQNETDRSLNLARRDR